MIDLNDLRKNKEEFIRSLLKRGLDVIGYDNLNEYYDPSLKAARLAELNKLSSILFLRLSE